MTATTQPIALITGQNGAIGKWALKALINQRYKVVGIGRGHSFGELPLPSSDVSLHEMDVTLAALRSLDLRPDLILHCAGSGSVGASISAPHADFHRTVGTTLEVLEFMRTECPNARLVYPSSAAVYGACDAIPITEEHPLKPASPYGVHKKIAEELIADYAHTHRLSAVIIRLFSIYGEGFRKQLLWDACCKIRRGNMQFFGTGDETRDWLHAADAAALLISSAACASPDCPIINGGAGEAIAVRSVITNLARLLGASAPIEFCGTQRPGDPIHYHAEISRTRQFGWSPSISLHDGLARYTAWFEQQDCGTHS